MKRIVAIAAAIAALASQSVNAGSQALAQQFVEALQYDRQFEEARAGCLKTNSAIGPEKFLNITSENPGPVPPGSALWPKVVAAYDAYWHDVCARPTREEYLSAVVKSYARTLDDIALKDAIKFYSTASGKRLIEANAVATHDIYAEWHRLNAQSYPVAISRLQKTLESVGEEAAIARCRERSSTRTAEAPCSSKSS